MLRLQKILQIYWQKNPRDYRYRDEKFSEDRGTTNYKSDTYNWHKDSTVPIPVLQNSNILYRENNKKTFSSFFKDNPKDRNTVFPYGSLAAPALMLFRIFTRTRIWIKK
jgi:hypothetical protein